MEVNNPQSKNDCIYIYSGLIPRGKEPWSTVKMHVQLILFQCYNYPNIFF